MEKEGIKKIKKSLIRAISEYIPLIIIITLWIALVWFIYIGYWFGVFISFLSLFFVSFPYIFEKRYKVKLPLFFEIVIILFIYASLFLGEAHELYYRIWWWDIFVHSFSGIALGFTGFVLLYYLYYEKKVNAKPITIAFFAFCFALTLGTLWEIAEFLGDIFFKTAWQEDLIDTMTDLIVDSLGALFSSIIGYIYFKFKNKDGK